MRKILFFMLLICSANISAQDVIVKKDGSTIISKVLEVNIADIKYKKFSNLNGPTYTISKSDVMAINYKNGEKDVFNNNTSQQSGSSSKDPLQPRMIKRNVAKNNSELIESYNVQIGEKEKPSKNDASYIDAFLAVTSSSVLSNEDLEISFVKGVTTPDTDYLLYEEFDIIIENKSNRTIYIDKGNCFRVVNKEPYCYYDGTEQITIGRSSGSGASLGLGSVASVLGIGGVAGQLANGVSVGSSSSKMSSTTYVTQRIIAIPPHSKRKLCENKVVNTNAKRKIIDPRENFKTFDITSDGSFSNWHCYASHFGFKKGDVKKGQILTFNENNTPYQRIYMLTYSNEENFSTYSTVNFSLYLKYVFGYGLAAFSTSKSLKNIDYLKIDRIVDCRYAELK